MAKLVFSGEVEIGGRVHDALPMLLDQHNLVVWPATRFLRYERVVSGLSKNSVFRYAGEIKQFLDFLENKKMSFEDSSDELLMRFGNSTLESNNDETIQGKINTVVRFLLWGQSRGYYHGVVGVNDIAKRHTYPVTISCADYDFVAREPRGTYKTTIQFRGRQSNSGMRKIPDQKALDALFDGMASKHHSMSELIYERNVLIALCARQAGLRRQEICESLKVKDLPDEEFVRSAEASNKLIQLPVVGKGRKLRKPSFTPELVLALIDHCKYARPLLLSKSKENRGRRQAEEIFISSKTGNRLKPQSITELISDAANRGGVKISPHLLRVLALTDIYKSMRAVTHDDETALVKTAQMAGHNQISTTTKHYIKLDSSYLLGDAEKRYVEAGSVELLKAQLKVAQKMLRNKE